MWVGIGGPERHRIIAKYVKSPGVTVWTPPSREASYLHFPNDVKRIELLMWLQDNDVPYALVPEPPFR